MGGGRRAVGSDGGLRLVAARSGGRERPCRRRSGLTHRGSGRPARRLPFASVIGTAGRRSTTPKNKVHLYLCKWGEALSGAAEFRAADSITAGEGQTARLGWRGTGRQWSLGQEETETVSNGQKWSLDQPHKKLPAS